MRYCVSCMETFHPWSDELSCWKCAPRGKAPARRVAAPVRDLVLADGGKSDVRPTEENDCTVRALALALDILYVQAYGWLAKNGRQPNKGCNFARILHRNNYRLFGYTVKPEAGIKRARGLRTFLERNPQLRTGVWVLHSTRHASTLKEGKLYDSFDSTRKTFDGAWAVKKGI